MVGTSPVEESTTRTDGVSSRLRTSKLTASSLNNPAAVAVAVAVIVLFGAFSLTRLPVQLFPDIENPKIAIQTGWRAASPREIESEIIEPIETVLRGLPGLKELSGFAHAGEGWIDMEFGLDTDMQRTLIEVISRMNRLDPLPRDATQPVIMLGGNSGDQPALTYFFMQLLPGTPGKIYDYIQFVEDVVRPAIEVVPGVARVAVSESVGRRRDTMCSSALVSPKKAWQRRRSSRRNSAYR